MAALFEKLVLDIGKPIRIEPAAFIRKVYFSPDDMKLLVAFTKLKELRIFGMHESFQSVIWKTVFRNTTDKGMSVLDLQMATPPLVS